MKFINLKFLKYIYQLSYRKWLKIWAFFIIFLMYSVDYVKIFADYDTNFSSKYEIIALRSSLFKLNSIIDATVLTATKKFYKNFGQNMHQPILVLENGTYLNFVDIKNNYVIRFSFFHDKLKFSHNYVGHFPETPILFNKKIALLPYFSYKNSNDEIIDGLPPLNQFESLKDKITIKYQCFTDIDQNIRLFQNQTENSIGNLSIISQNSDNFYLQNCIYDPNFLNSAW